MKYIKDMESDFGVYLEGLKSKLSLKVKPVGGKLPKVTASPVISFSDKFDDLNQQLIYPIVTTVNSKLGEYGYALEVVKSPDEVADIRKSIQIFLTNQEKPLNVLEDPYVLVEGYPQSGSVRLVESGSTYTGEMLPVGKIDEKLIESSISNMLDKYLFV